MSEHKKVKNPLIEAGSKLDMPRGKTPETFRFFPSPTSSQKDLPEFCSLSFADPSDTSRQAHALLEKSRYWSDKIKMEFKQTIPVQPHQHSHRRIYYHFKQRARRIKPNCDYHLHYLEKIAIFQSSLSDEQLKIHILFYCLKAAAHVGNLALVQWLMSAERGKKQVIPDQQEGEQVLENAAYSGNLALVKWLTSAERGALRLYPNWQTLAKAASSGNIKLVQWLYQLEIDYVDPFINYVLVDIPSTIFSHAATSGNLALVQWLTSSDRGERRIIIKSTDDPLSAAAESGNLTLVEWLIETENLPTSTPEVISHAAQSGNLHLLQRLIPPIRYFMLDTHWYNDTIFWATRSGNLSMIMWLMSEDCPLRLIPNAGALKAAAENGHLHIVQYLMSAERGDLQVNPTPSTLNAAIRSGNIELVEWLTAPERGAQKLVPNQKSLQIGLKTGNFTVVEWLMSPERSPQIYLHYWNMIKAAGDKSDAFFFQWLMSPDRGSHRINPNLLLPIFARHGNLEGVEWIISCNATPTQDTVRRAALSANVKLVRWLISPERGNCQVIPRQATVDFVKNLNNTAFATVCQEMEKLLRESQRKSRRVMVLSGLNSHLGGKSFLFAASQRSSFDQQVFRTVFNFSGDPSPLTTQRVKQAASTGLKNAAQSSSVKQSESDLLDQTKDSANFSSRPWF